MTNELHADPLRIDEARRRLSFHSQADADIRFDVAEHRELDDPGLAISLTSAMCLSVPNPSTDLAPSLLTLLV